MRFRVVVSFVLVAVVAWLFVPAPRSHRGNPARLPASCGT